MANYRKSARQQAHAETMPQIQSTRRGVRQESRALRSMENPLVAAVENQIDALKHAGLRGPERERALESAAASLAAIPAGISSQVLSTHEAGNEAIGDLRTQEAAQAAALLSQLQTAAADHAQSQQDEIAAEGRQARNTIALEQQEKELGLGEYAPDALDPLEQAQVGKVQAETEQLEHPDAASSLTPSERRGLSEDHTAAAHYAKEFFQKAKAGEIEGVDPDPKGWDSATWDHLVTAVAQAGKVPVGAAEQAVGAVQDHVRTAPTALGALGTVASAATRLVAPPLFSKLAQSAVSGY